jgi:predicted CXXCH cytochrome family protein
MRKLLAISATLAACLTFGLAPAFATGIAGSKHDLSAAGYGSTELCIFCHTPHAAKASASGPLWNHAASSATYTIYVFASGTHTIGQPGPASASCLSCHDGTVGIEAYGSANTTTHLMTGDALIGTDLTNDHPIGVVFPTTGSSYKSTHTTPLYNGKVECASCHAVHDNTNPPFLRMANGGSALCLDCHSK